MSNENEKPQWRVFGASIKGASHVRSGMPNQDAILWKTGENGGLPLVLAIADGHGSDKYFRSDVGAKLAVQVAVEEMERFALALPPSITNFTFVKHRAGQLPNDIVQKWKEAVEQHVLEVPFFTKEEMQRFRKPEHQKEYQVILQMLGSNPNDATLPYGATLLTVLVASSFILYFQLGDGDIVKVTLSGRSIKPVKGDARLLANETTSLCSPTAAQDFRKRLDTFEDEPPALIMLSTDGYSNSFISQDGFLKVGSDILKMLRTDGLEKVENSVEGWLEKATEDGSGDDISLGIICHPDAFKAPATLPEGPPVHLPEDDETNIASATAGRSPASVSQQGTVITMQTEKKEENAPVVASAQDQTVSAPVQPINPQEAVVHNHAPTVPAGGRKVIVVSPRPGEGDYTTISAALHHASPKARIEVHPGNYTENLFLQQDVELVATGSQEEVVIESKSTNTPCLQIFATHALIQGFTLRGKVGFGRLLQKDRAVVEILGGQSTLAQCDITSRSLLGVKVQGPTTSPTIKECAIHHCEGIGIVFSNSTGGQLENSQVYENKGPGILVERRSHPTIHNCDVYRGQSRGIVFLDHAGGRMEDSQVYENQRTGIVIEGESHPTIFNCHIHDGQSRGLSVRQNSTGMIEKCMIRANASAGIYIAQSDPVIQGCEISEGKEHGIEIAGGSRGTIKDCRILENDGRGIQITDSSFPLIKDCRLRGGKRSGIWIYGQAGGVFENCDLEGHESVGIGISQQGIPVIRKCRVYGGKKSGVYVEDRSSATLEDCKIDDNAEYGVVVTTGSNIKISGGHIRRHQDANLCAVLVGKNSEATIERCRIEDQGNIGVKAQEHANVFLRACSIEGRYYAAVVSQQSEMHLESSSYKTSDTREKPWVIEEGSALYIDGKRY